MHYLGKPKRRMYRAHKAGGNAPQPGDLLYSDDMQGQSSGMVIDAAPDQNDSWDLLASVQVDSAASQVIKWLALDGEPLPSHPSSPSKADAPKREKCLKAASSLALARFAEG